MQSPLPETETTSPPTPPRSGGFRRAVLRGLGVVLPPLLTIAVLIWAWSTIESYVLAPIELSIRSAIVNTISPQRTYSSVPQGAIPTGERRLDGFTFKGERYVPDPTRRRFLPEEVVNTVNENADRFGPYTPAPASANAYWHRYVEISYMPRSVVVPVFLIVFLTVLYFVGRLFTFGLGHWFVRSFDATILRIPIVNKVYGGVKQVTDFAFSDREIEFNRVVAIEYPAKGIWSLGFVTGNGMKEISIANGEPMLSVLMPTSPMPMTGFTVTVKRSDAIDLNLTVDEAIQFIVSCGVVVPPQQRYDQPTVPSPQRLTKN
ncbi:hypothetical protein CA13_43640 [Planctomycetes bacterium CA13]|uniref:DUF502 domain-containing protein n=1 Tax=Novipirellula herctigrandis TaxID=2527986 RepID=A0A5C5Z7U2_9BACT|nr:hypothetical protein CA13_43640 [Planctomycetes bacterium CA13]